VIFRLAGLLATLGSLAAQSRPDDLPAALGRLVDLPDAKARRTKALELAGRLDATLDDWLLACASFGEFAPAAPGPHHESVELAVLGKAEATSISWYVPKGYDPKGKAPLLLAMHGTGMSGRNEHLMWSDACEKLGMLIVAPSESGPNEGYAYTERERQAALAALRWMRRRCNVDEARVFCSGESRGGHMTWDLALRRPDLFAALAPMIGAPRLNPAEGQNNLRYLEGIAHIPIRDLQGSKDDPQLVFNVREAFAKLAAIPAKDARLIEFEELGHSFKFGAVDWVEWLGQIHRDPTPAKVVLRYARKGEARAAWLEVTGYTKPVEEEVRPKLTQKALDELNKKSEDERRRWWNAQAEERTGRAVGTLEKDGSITVESKGASGIRLVLDDAILAGRKEVEVKWNGKAKKCKVVRSARVLLPEFAERFDRSFLPVAEIVLP
jgi:predicted esterase